MERHRGGGRLIRFPSWVLRAGGPLAPLLACWCAAAALFALGPAHVGFLSTDYDILRVASRARWFEPLEQHHWSLLLTNLFSLTSAGVVGRPVWVALAFVGHCANTALVWRLLLRWNAAWTSAALVAGLSALSPAGFEALAWSCAVGYVLVTTVLLAALGRLLEPRRASSAKPRWDLAALQLLALLVWDWGILLTPLVAWCLVVNGRGAGGLRANLAKGLLVLWPSLACLALALVLRTALGRSLGYAVAFSPLRASYLLVSAPLRVVYPNGPTPFYRSGPGLGLSLLLVSALGLRAVRDRRVATLFGAFLVCQIPYVFLGAPESRYFYVGAPFLYAALVHTACTLRLRPVLVGGAAALLVANAAWAAQRAALWKGASREARRIKEAIEERTRSPAHTIVVVNLPDRYGPKDMMWRPFVWRDGLCAIEGKILRVNTPGSPFTWPESGIPVMDREEILAAYGSRDIVEVTYASRGDWRRFEVVDLHKARRHPSDDQRRRTPLQGESARARGRGPRAPACVPASTQHDDPAPGDRLVGVGGQDVDAAWQR